MRAQPGAHLYERVRERSTSTLAVKWGPSTNEDSYDLKMHEMTFLLLKNKLGSTDVILM